MKNKYSEPNSEGFFGSYGGKFVPETLMEALDELEKCYEGIKSDSEFQKIERNVNHNGGRSLRCFI